MLRAGLGLTVALGALVGLPSPASATPTNDLPTAPTVMTSANPTQVTGTNVHATDADEPTGYGVRKVWFSWTAPASGTVQVDTFGSTFDTVVAVWTSGLSHLADGDDSRSTFQSETNFTATSGTTYLFSVGSYTGSNGDTAPGYIRLFVSFGDGLQFGPGTRSVTPVSLPPSPVPPVCGGLTMDTSYRWFSFVAPGGNVTIDTFGSTVDTVLFGYAWSSQTNSVTCTTSNDDTWNGTGNGLQSQITLSGGAHTREFVLVGAYHAGESAAITFNFSGFQDAVPAFPTPPAKPTAPQNLTAAATASGVHLNWSAPASNGGAQIWEYDVYRGPSGAESQLGATAPPTTTYDDAPGNGTWSYLVTAVNDAGESVAATVSVTVSPPAAPTGVTAAAGDTSATVSWSAASDNGSAPVEGYTVTSNPDARSCTTSGALQCTVADLTNGTAYTFSVVATNVVGDSPSSGYSNSVTPAGHPLAPTNVTATPSDKSARVSWAASGPNGASVTAYTATSTPDGHTCSTTGALQCTVTGLTNGTAYTFSVVGTNAIGDSPASQPSNQVTPADTTLPTVTVHALPTFTLASRVGVQYSGTDNEAVANYDVRYRRAPFNGTFEAPVYPSGWQHTAATSVSLAAAKGYTYCFSVLSRDTSGNTSLWSAERCIGVALDDRSLAATSAWMRSTGTVYYASTVTRTTASKAGLTRTGVQTKRIAVVATRCPGCGTIGLYWNGVLLKKVALDATTTLNKQVITIASFTSVRTGTLTVKTLTTGSTRIDGLALRRT